jgi:hypothetical protein
VGKWLAKFLTDIHESVPDIPDTVPRVSALSGPDMDMLTEISAPVEEGVPISPLEPMGHSEDQSTQATQDEEIPTPKFRVGQYIRRTDNEGHTRMGIIEYEPRLEEMSSSKREYWYIIRETIYTHESRLTDAGKVGNE